MDALRKLGVVGVLALAIFGYVSFNYHSRNARADFWLVHRPRHISLDIPSISEVSRTISQKDIGVAGRDFGSQRQAFPGSLSAALQVW